MDDNHTLLEIAKRFCNVRLYWCMQCNEPIILAWITDCELDAPPPALVNLAMAASISAYVISPIDAETAHVRKVWPHAQAACTLTMRQFMQVISSHRARHTCRAVSAAGTARTALPEYTAASYTDGYARAAGG